MTKAIQNFNIELRAVIYREDGVWLAHCLEMDIVAEGNSPQQACRDVIELCELQIRVALEEGDIQSVFRPAPPETWKMYFMSHTIRPTPYRTPPKTVAQPSSRTSAKSLPTRRSVQKFEVREFELV